MTAESITWWLGLVVLVSPALLVAALSCAALLSLRLTEATIAKLTQFFVVTGFVAAAIVFAAMLGGGSRHVEISLGNWANVHTINHADAFHFSFSFVFDRLSVPFLLLSFVLIGTIGAFAQRYLHRERGYGRFFTLYALFLLGMVVVALAGTVETLFIGWEFVGLSSALLVAFFQDRPAPVRNGMRVWAVYRIADAAFLLAAIALHHGHGKGDFSILTGEGSWPYGVAEISPTSATIIGLLLLIAAAGKSALLPFCEWLPKAMEGPTPSSAIFYGALSVHLGAYLLLRVSPLLALSPLVCGCVIALGLATAFYASRVARVQTDVKSALAFASLTQVGLITAEIGCGFNYFALAHLVGHASLRALQLIRASSMLDDHALFENAIGGRAHQASTRPGSEVIRSYRVSLMRWSLDAWIDRIVVHPLLGLMRACDHFETSVTRRMDRPRRTDKDVTDTFCASRETGAA